MGCWSVIRKLAFFVELRYIVPGVFLMFRFGFLCCKGYVCCEQDRKLSAYLLRLYCGKWSAVCFKRKQKIVALLVRFLRPIVPFVQWIRLYTPYIGRSIPSVAQSFVRVAQSFVR